MKTLSALEVSRLKAPGRYAVGEGAYLQITNGNGRSWIFRYQRDGRQRHMGLGPFNLLTLSEARERARAARRLLLDGIDPLESRAANRQLASLEAARGITFKDCALRYIAANEAAWRNPVHRKQWHSTLTAYVFPAFGNFTVGAVDTALVSKVLEPIWAIKPETAGRVRGRIEVILDWAKARGFRDGENPARWRGHLDKLFPSRSKVRRVKHHVAMPYPQVPHFMATLRTQTGISARALEFTVLCAARTNETLQAEWNEFNLGEKVWIVPANRMKGGREHRIPLSIRVIKILQQLPRQEKLVFPGARPGKPLSNMAMLQMLRGMEGKGLTVHGFRSSFRDWGSERTNYPNEMLEMALAHVVDDKTEAAYRRGDMFDKRRKLMESWASYCSSGAGTSSRARVPRPVVLA